LGEIETVQVKQSITRVAARCLHPQVARVRIREAAERALQLTGAPFVLSSPITVRVTFQRALHADLAAMAPGSQRVDGRTVQWTGGDMPAVYGAFRALTALAALARR
jgi:D-amino peptidase